MTHNQLLRDLQTEMWDFYKDVHGVRPRDWTKSEWDSIEFLQRERESLFKCLDAMSAQEKINGGWGSDSPAEFEAFMLQATGPARS